MWHPSCCYFNLPFFLVDRPCSRCSIFSFITDWDANLPSTRTDDYIASIFNSSTRTTPFCAITSNTIPFSLCARNLHNSTMAESPGLQPLRISWLYYELLQFIILWPFIILFKDQPDNQHVPMHHHQQTQKNSGGTDSHSYCEVSENGPLNSCYLDNNINQELLPGSVVPSPTEEAQVAQWNFLIQLSLCSEISNTQFP